MQQLHWLDHIGSIQEGMGLVNKFYWNLTIKQEANQWFVRSGEKVIFSTDSPESLDAFLYGLSLAYAVLPNDIIEYLETAIKDVLE